MSGASDGKLTALVVEDEALIAMDLGIMLEDLGVDVLGPFASAPEAEAALNDGLPDIALLDFNLRGHTSEDLAVRLLDSSVPVAIITGLAMRRLPDSLQGAVVIQKPIIAANLESLLGMHFSDELSAGRRFGSGSR